MVRKCLAATAFVLVCVAPAMAQAPVDNPPIQAVISGPTDIVVGRTIVLDASVSAIDGADVRYQWFVGDRQQSISRTVEALYTPDTPGDLTFRLVIEAADGRRSEVTHHVTAYRRKLVIVGDPTLIDGVMALHGDEAKRNGVYLRTIRITPPAAQFGAEEAVARVFLEQRDAFLGAQAIVLWGDDITFLQAFQHAFKDDAELVAGLRNQTIVLLSENNLHILDRTARVPFGVLNPASILLTRPEATAVLIEAADMTMAKQQLAQRAVEFAVLDATTTSLRPWNLLTGVVTSMRTNGVSAEVIIILLSLPIIVTFLAFLKQVVGVTTLGLSTPTIMTLSFLALGWTVGLLGLLCILVATYGTRSLLRRWRLLYVPKIAIILTVVTIILLAFLGLSAMFGRVFSRETIVLLLMLATLSESFLSLRSDEGFRAALQGIGETVAAALICAALIRWSAFQTLLLAYPETVLLTFVINIFLGRWTGLRIVEYFRFREVFRHLYEE